MSTLDPAIKNIILISMMLGMAFVFFIILLVLTYKKRQTRLLIEKKLSEAELAKEKLQNEINTLKAIHDEKERISSDIHDDMGGNVTSINLLSKLIQLNGSPDKTSEHLKELNWQSLELNQKMKDIVWATKSENDYLDHLIHYIQQYAIRQLEPLGFQLKINKPTQIPLIELNGEMRKDIFMSVKECFNNIIKHSNANKIILDIHFQNSLLNIVIQDNGKGLEEKQNEGNGLKNISKRIQKHGGHVAFKNQDGLNVSIQLTLPSSNKLETI